MKKYALLSAMIMTLSTATAQAADTTAAPAAPSAPGAATETPKSKDYSGHPPMSGAAMPAAGGEAAAAPAAPPEPIKGKVIQTMTGGGYSYAYVEQADGSKVWVAVSATPITVGSEMTFKPGVQMGKFESRALKRTFDAIIFSDGVISGAAKAQAADPGKGEGTSPGSSGAGAAKAAKISVEKATGPNAQTVETAYKNSAKLNKKKVVIRGQVVKVSTGIMSKNWIHIQDGTGSEKKKNHNLVCTSATDIADVGDVVTITGTLIKDRDFGAGYKYPVIIENTTISKQ